VSCSTTISRNSLLILLSAIGCAAPQAGAEPSSGTGTSDFTLRDVEGRTVRLSDHRGKVVLLNFWATWCVPCKGELPHLQRIYETHRDAGFVVLGISMDGPESIANVGPEVRRYGLTFPILLDEETRVVGVYNPKRAAPFNVLISREGSIERTREGYSSGDEIAMEEDIKKLLGGVEQ
jgi:peroxiredoxin